MDKIRADRPRYYTVLIAMLFTVLASPGLLFAHAGVTHDDPGITTAIETQSVTTSESSTEASGTVLTSPDKLVNKLPENIANIGGPFSLTNHLGEPVTEKTYAGKHMLVFFGYSNCQIMCSVSLKRIGDALSILQADSDAPLSKIHPLVITVDPANDTPARLRKSLETYHPALTGLTGSLAQLKPVYKAYKQKPSILDMELNASAVVSHSSFFYLMDQNGKLQTFFPPILSSESMAKLIKKYLPI